MSEFKLTTVEEFEAATARLLETGAKVGADSWQMRVKNCLLYTSPSPRDCS